MWPSRLQVTCGLASSETNPGTTALVSSPRTSLFCVRVHCVLDIHLLNDWLLPGTCSLSNTNTQTLFLTLVKKLTHPFQWCQLVSCCSWHMSLPEISLLASLVIDVCVFPYPLYHTDPWPLNMRLRTVKTLLYLLITRFSRQLLILCKSW